MYPSKKFIATVNDPAQLFYIEANNPDGECLSLSVWAGSANKAVDDLLTYYELDGFADWPDAFADNPRVYTIPTDPRPGALPWNDPVGVPTCTIIDVGARSNLPPESRSPGL